MAGKTHEIGAFWRFFASGFRTWDQTAAFFPSSRFLVNALTDHAELREARTILELGTGTGTVTRGILKQARADAEIYSVEIDGKLIESASTSIRDPRLRWIHGSAADLERLLPDHGCAGPVDVVVSSLGMSLLPPELRDAISDAVLRTLAPHGIYIQYAYVHARAMTWSPERGFSRFNIRRYLSPRFGELNRTIIVPNMPPAAVYTCREPRAPLTAGA
ncbi:MAG: methyltransferase domain-containing protein [Myxococcales bacterium]|nr:methyltransferase domain-containing protein [Myxococcales bacterium]MCB9570284.1 methyltransferase domain-containing protein [Myxococcales bacterium]MCB9703871.1 methyltransferase domain-containing protein [Myxococcales bacterium]